MRVDNIPAGTTAIRVEFNDLSYQPLSYDGGHGVIEYAHGSGTSATLKSVPAYTANLSKGVRVVSAARSGDEYASDGYLPPCSGGRGNTYSATIKAMDGDDVLAETTLALGRY